MLPIIDKNPKKGQEKATMQHNATEAQVYM